MERKRFLVSGEPRDSSYRELLEGSCGPCAYALLVVRDSAADRAALAPATEALSEWLVSRELRSQWPGTILYEDEAAIYRYRLDSGLVSRLLRLTRGLYDWMHPNLPEDLCLLRQDLEPWLVSISHEREAFMVLSEDERTDISRFAPLLAPLLRYP